MAVRKRSSDGSFNAGARRADFRDNGLQTAARCASGAHDPYGRCAPVLAVHCFRSILSKILPAMGTLRCASIAIEMDMQAVA